MSSSSSSAAKRPADEEWASGDRARRTLDDGAQKSWHDAMDAVNDALRTANTLMASLPAASIRVDGCHREHIKANVSVLLSSMTRIAAPAPAVPKHTGDMTIALPDDCVQIIMEFAIGRRLMATFGAGGRVNEARGYYGNYSNSSFQSIHTLRAVSRKWNRIASRLASVMQFKLTHMRIPFDCTYMANLFPNVTQIKFAKTKVIPRTFADNLETIKTLLISKRPAIKDPRAIFMHRPITVAADTHQLPFSWTRRFYRPNGDFVRHIYVVSYQTDLRSQEMPSLPALPSDVWRFIKFSTFFEFMKKMKPTAEMQANPITIQLTYGYAGPTYDDAWIQQQLDLIPDESCSAVQIHALQSSACLHPYQLLQAKFPRPIIYHVTTTDVRRWRTISSNVYTDATAYHNIVERRCMLEPIV